MVLTTSLPAGQHHRGILTFLEREISTRCAFFTPMSSAALRVFVADGGLGKNTLTFLDLATGKREKVVQLEEVSSRNALAMSPDGSVHAVAARDKGLTFVDANMGALIKTVAREEVNCVAWSADGKRVAAGTNSSEVVLIDPSTYEVVRKVREHSNLVFTVAFSPSSGLLMSGSYDRTAIIYSAHDLTVLKTLTGHESRVSCAVFIDEDRVATGSDDKSIRIWDVTSGETIHTIKEHSDWVLSLALSPNCRLLVSGGGDKKLILYDAETYAVTKTVECKSWVNSICFVDDSTLLAGVEHSEMISVDVRTGEATELEGKYDRPSIVVSDCKFYYLSFLPSLSQTPPAPRSTDLTCWRKHRRRPRRSSTSSVRRPLQQACLTPAAYENIGYSPGLAGAEQIAKLLAKFTNLEHLDISCLLAEFAYSSF